MIHGLNEELQAMFSETVRTVNASIGSNWLLSAYNHLSLHSSLVTSFPSPSGLTPCVQGLEQIGSVLPYHLRPPYSENRTCRQGVHTFVHFLMSCS